MGRLALECVTPNDIIYLGLRQFDVFWLLLTIRYEISIQLLAFVGSHCSVGCFCYLIPFVSQSHRIEMCPLVFRSVRAVAEGFFAFEEGTGVGFLSSVRPTVYFEVFEAGKRLVATWELKTKNIFQLWASS